MLTVLQLNKTRSWVIVGMIILCEALKLTARYSCVSPHITALWF